MQKRIVNSQKKREVGDGKKRDGRGRNGDGWGRKRIRTWKKI